MAEAMAEILASCVSPDAWEARAIVPVAPHPSRRRQTGVDHTRLLADAFAALIGRPVSTPLRRSGESSRQAGASLRERTRSGRVEFSPAGLVPRAVLLLDDVWTTGTTLTAASQCLVGAGCDSLVVASWSRALADPPSVHRPVDW